MGSQVDTRLGEVVDRRGGIELMLRLATVGELHHKQITDCHNEADVGCADVQMCELTWARAILCRALQRVTGFKTPAQSVDLLAKVRGDDAKRRTCKHKFTKRVAKKKK